MERTESSGDGEPEPHSDSDLVRHLAEEALASGRSAAELCAGRPDLLPALERRLRQVRRLAGEVAELFPSSSTSGTFVVAEPVLPGYRIEAELGRGGMGVVYRAVHEALGRAVALKMMLSGPFASAAERLRFQREAQLVAQLRHPNIVPIYEVGEVAGRPYYTMELIHGPSLAVRLRAGPLPVVEAAALLLAVARAMDHAHRQGIIHRDLKPANILLAADGTPRVGDFGLARRFDTDGASVTRSRLGTPRYMAPEQAAGEATALLPTVDVFSLGVILYELLAGAVPWPDGAPTGPIATAVPPPSPTQRNRAVPRDLATICLHCLQRDPRRRYAAAGELADDLDLHLRGLPIRARRTGRFERTWRWMVRRPGIALAVLLTTLSCFGLGWSVLATVAEQQRRDCELIGMLEQAEASELRADWSSAAATLAVVRSGLARDGSPNVRRRFDEVEANLALAQRLERLRRWQLPSLDALSLEGRRRQKLDAAYATAFAATPVQDEPTAVADAALAVARSPIRATMLAAIDDWLLQLSAGDVARRDRLLAVQRLADAQQDAWSLAARDPQHWLDVPTLQRLLADEVAPSRSTSLLLVLAQRLQWAGGDAVPALERLAVAKPQDPWLHHALGMLTARSAPLQSVAYFRVLLAVSPGAYAEGSYGRALAAAGRLAEGVEYLRQSIAHDPTLDWVQTNLGVTLMHLGRHAEAEAAFAAAVALDPSSLEALVGRAGALRAMRRREDAEALLAAAEQRGPDEPFVRNARGAMLMDAGRHKEAVALFEQVLATADDGNVRRNLARCLNVLGRRDEALAEAARAAALLPRDDDARVLHGEMLARAGRIDEGLAELRAALALAPHRETASTSLGVCLAIDWQMEPAIEAFRAALAIEPGHGNAVGGLAQALLLVGRFDEAVTAARHYATVADARSGKLAGQLVLQSEQLLQAAPATLHDPSRCSDPAMARMLLAHAVHTGRLAALAPMAERMLELAGERIDDLRDGLRVAAARVFARLVEVGGDSAAAAAARALQLLGDDLASRSHGYAFATPRDRLLLRRYAERWFTDPAFASVRDPERLGALPPAQVAEWLAFWSDLRAWLDDTA